MHLQEDSMHTDIEIQRWQQQSELFQGQRRISIHPNHLYWSLNAELLWEIELLHCNYSQSLYHRHRWGLQWRLNQSSSQRGCYPKEIVRNQIVSTHQTSNGTTDGRLDSINWLVQAPYMIRKNNTWSWSVSLRKCHVYFFIQLTMKKRIGYVHLRKRPTFYHN